MADGKMDAEWWHTANILCLHVNMNRKKNAKARQPHEFHPLHSRKKVTKKKGDIAWLKALLPKGDPDRKSFEQNEPVSKD